MTLPVFPSLPGQGIAVKKTPRFDTRVAMHASGREGRARSFLNPLWDFELVFEGLASDDATYVGLGEQTMQTLAGFFMACQGQALPFLYLDPTDSVATARQIGVGDGTNKTFALTHSLGTWWSAPVECVISVTAVYYNGVAQSVGWTYPTASSVKMPTAPTAGVVVTADYTYAYQVRFSEDVIDLEEFMALLHGCRTVKFQSARQPVAAWSKATISAFFVNNTDFVVPGTIDLIEVYSGGAGGVGGGGGAWDGSGSGSHGGGGGGGYAYVRNPSVTVGDVLSIVVGAGGQGLDVNDPFGADINKGGDTYVGPQPSWAGGVPGATPLVWCAGAGKGTGGYQFTSGSAWRSLPRLCRRPGRLVSRARRRRRLRRRRRGAAPTARAVGARQTASIRTPAAAAALATAARPAPAPLRAAGAAARAGRRPMAGARAARAARRRRTRPGRPIRA